MYSCTFIGHSNCDHHVKTNLYSSIEKLIKEHDVTTFYVGTHGNFDHYAYTVLCELEKIYDIEILVVLSCLDKAPLYCDTSKTIFPDMVAKSPFKYAIIKRNQYMISRSQFMICYINNTFTNTYTFVKLALDKKLQIINLGKFDLNNI